MFLTVKRFKQDSKVSQSPAMSSETFLNDLHSSVPSPEPNSNPSLEQNLLDGRAWGKNEVYSGLYPSTEAGDRCIN